MVYLVVNDILLEQVSSISLPYIWYIYIGLAKLYGRVVELPR